ncbi:MAG: hypothetical protein ACREXW_19325 [Gammaproteobacteria bacterium]
MARVVCLPDSEGSASASASAIVRRSVAGGVPLDRRSDVDDIVQIYAYASIGQAF